MAKIFGVGVEVFSIGFGKKLLKIKRGETTYAIGVIPLGGYVQLKGVLPPEATSEKEQPKEEAEDKTSEAGDKQEKKSIIEATYDDQRALRGRSLVTKVAIFLSGVSMNYLTAVAVLTALVLMGYQESAPFLARIGLIETPMLSQQYDVRVGDTILKVNGMSVNTWDDMMDQIVPVYRRGEGQKLSMKISRDDHISTLTLPLYLGDNKTSPVFALLQPYIPAYVDGIIPNKPAEKAGMQRGDFIISINNVKTPTWWSMVEFIRNNPGKELIFRIKRGDREMIMPIIPKPSAEDPRVGEIGIAMGNPEKIVVKEGLFGAVEFGFTKSVAITIYILRVTHDVYRRINLQLAKENIGGPVAIAIISYKAARKSLDELLLFFVGFNIMLVILNVLPIPLFDGGHIFIAIIEKIVGRPIPPKFLMKVYMAVLFLLIALALLVTYNDIIMNLWRLGWLWR